MARRQFSREFKLEAIRLVKERGVSVVQVSRDLDVGENVLRRWTKEFTSDPGQAFAGQGQLKPEQQEIDRLRREVAKLKAERDILKSRGLLREGVVVKFGFITKHRGIWPVRWPCEALDVSRSGFHASLIRSPSARACSDQVLGAQVKASFVDSDRTYGARRVWHDVLAEGAACGLHRVERLMREQACGPGLAAEACPRTRAHGTRRRTTC